MSNLLQRIGGLPKLKQSTRKGAVTVLVAILMLISLGCVALTDLIRDGWHQVSSLFGRLPDTQHYKELFMRSLAKKTRSVLDGEDGVSPADYAVIVGLIIVLLGFCKA